MSVDYWEPWKPEIGQRVRVRLSGECQFIFPVCPDCGNDVQHSVHEDGRTATVEGIHDGELMAHYYEVRFDRPVPSQCSCADSSYDRFFLFAAAELEPVE